ncbi:hypothetical protein PS928_04589 [Pseudomonas fluorescens]|uniref:Uncharacterized protein n=1 Tax=Pseudomonas fluorescens TaxID=294 RepID=A0A5E7V4R9_PSEFL|nr:hypothetical protein PS928_04589 [Pseudomonas fluorescens]
MAFDAFVKIEGIPGEALDETYRDGALVCGVVGGAVAGYVGGKIPRCQDSCRLCGFS